MRCGRHQSATRAQLSLYWGGSGAECWRNVGLFGAYYTTGASVPAAGRLLISALRISVPPIDAVEKALAA